MNYFVKSIKVNKLLHLQDFIIPIESSECPHLLLTGKNGTGKTILLRAIADFLQTVSGDSNLSFLKLKDHIALWQKELERANNPQDKLHAENMLKKVQTQFENLYGKVEVEFNDIFQVAELIKKNEFLFAFYKADRKANMIEPKQPELLDLDKKTSVSETKTQKFLTFLLNLKVQQSMARESGHAEEANKIQGWFADFEAMLKRIFEDPNLKLDFNYKNYSFTITSGGLPFKFTEMSDGFMAAIDIIADLILKMQSNDSLVGAYNKCGVVLIDEVETHMHIELHRIVMPLLTTLFPNIQFIVTTHSPYVLNSIKTAVAYDLKRRQPIDDLTEYSSDALADGYFGARSSSYYMDSQLANLRVLLEKEEMTSADKVLVKQLIVEFDKVSEVVSPVLVGEYMQLKIQYSDKIKAL